MSEAFATVEMKSRHKSENQERLSLLNVRLEDDAKGRAKNFHLLIKRMKQNVYFDKFC